MTNDPILKKLAAPFPESDIEWRMARAGRSNGKPWGICLAYITARAVMDRLDEVVGPSNWRPEYTILSSGIVCRLSLRVHGEWITKEDGSDLTDVEAFKGGLSGALKRAASVWGVARYLYRLEEGFAEFVPKGTRGAYMQKIDSEPYFWLPPKLPAWALPESAANAGVAEYGVSIPVSPTIDNPPASPVKPRKAVAERLGIKAETKPELDRQAQYKRIADLKDRFENEFKEPIKRTMKDRYQTEDARLMTVEQLQDLAGFMEATLGLADKSAADQAELPEHALDNFVIRVKGQHLGKTFKMLGREELERYARNSFEWFKRDNIKINKTWQDFFDRAAEYCFGSGDGGLFAPDASQPDRLPA